MKQSKFKNLIHNKAYSYFLVTLIITSTSGCANYIANKAFSSMDINGDGKITLEEYPREDITGSRSFEKTRQEFNRTDKNNDGVITPNEIFDDMLDHQ